MIKTGCVRPPIINNDAHCRTPLAIGVPLFRFIYKCANFRPADAEHTVILLDQSYALAGSTRQVATSQLGISARVAVSFAWYAGLVFAGRCSYQSWLRISVTCHLIPRPNLITALDDPKDREWQIEAVKGTEVYKRISSDRRHTPEVGFHADKAAFSKVIANCVSSACTGSDGVDIFAAKKSMI